MCASVRIPTAVGLCVNKIPNVITVFQPWPSLSLCMNPACGSERAEGEEDTALNSVAVSAERAMDILAAPFASRLKSVTSRGFLFKVSKFISKNAIMCDYIM